jgi:hypothetical protein
VRAGQESAEVRLVGGADPLLSVLWLDGRDERLPPIDFGQAATGQKGLRRTVRLRNDGRAPLLISAIDIPAAENPGGSFSLVGPTPNRVEPGGFSDLVVAFDDAVKLRDDAAKLRIASNDAVDAFAGGERRVDLVSTNAPNYDPVPDVRVRSCAPGTSNCQEAPVLDWEITVDASGSTGPEAGDTLTYAWSISTKPVGSTVRLAAPTAIETLVVSDAGSKVDVAGRYIVKLVVTDQFGNQSAPRTQVLDVSR